MAIKHITELFSLDGSAFLIECYNNLLRREPDVHGLKYYLGRLAQGHGKASVIAQLAKSRECRDHDEIRGLKQLIKEEKRASNWFWAQFNRKNSIERTLQSAIATLAQHITQLPPGTGSHSLDVKNPEKKLRNNSGITPYLETNRLHRNYFKTSNINYEKSKNNAVILFISHDASMTGAPAVLIEVARYILNNSSYTPYFLIGGEHEDRIKEFQSIGPCLHVSDPMKLVASDIETFLNYNIPAIVYCNTVVSAKLMQVIKYFYGDRCPYYVTHAHERKAVLNHFLAETRYIIENSDEIIAVSDDVRSEIHEIDRKRNSLIHVVPPLIKPFNSFGAVGRNQINLPISKSPRVFGCGTIETRKGFDLFCATISRLINSGRKIEGVWIGSSANDVEPTASLQKYQVEHAIKTVGPHPNPRTLYSEGDIFFLPSREDPFPLVVLEAAERGMAVLCFDEEAGSAASFIRKSGGGLVCRYLDVEDAAHCLSVLLDNNGMRFEMGKLGSKYVIANYYPAQVVPKIISLITDQKNKHDINSHFGLSQKRSVIVISFGPAPIFGIKQVEGGGLRSWGLATALAGTGIYNVTFDFPDWYIKQPDLFNDNFDNIKIRTWSNVSDIISHVSEYNIVIISFCYGSYSEAVCNAITPDQMLILDCYVPIYVEVSARRSLDRIGEFNNYLSDTRSWNANLERGNLLLCANEAQKSFYLGILYSRAENNPINYESSDNVIISPFGLDEKIVDDSKSTQQQLKDRPDVIKLLWFGGVYPWFDISSLIQAVKLVRSTIPCTLTIVGARNPFNSHPDFIKISQQVEEMASSEEFSDFVILEDWIPYDKRFEWYKNADLLITLNQPGIENIFAWRTRVVDYLASGTRFATNGGDPLSEKLIEIGLASRIDTSSAKALALTIETAIKNLSNDLIDEKELVELQRNLSWKTIGNTLSEAIERWWLRRI